MANTVKQAFLQELATKYGRLKKIGDCQSLFEIADGAARVYVRYSKIHPRGQAFYGLRQTDLKVLEGHASVICFLWDGQELPLIVPYADYEQVFQTINPADDGQYKVYVYPEPQGTELYV